MLKGAFKEGSRRAKWITQSPAQQSEDTYIAEERIHLVKINLHPSYRTFTTPRREIDLILPEIDQVRVQRLKQRILHHSLDHRSMQSSLPNRNTNAY